MDPRAATVTSPPFPTALRSLRILYADDVVELRQLARISLEREGHQVHLVEDGQQAWDLVQRQPDAYDVIITDHHMPVMDGMKLVTNLRTSPYRGHVLVFCSELSQGVNQRYQELGVDRILYKPVLPSELRRIIREMASAGEAPPTA